MFLKISAPIDGGVVDLQMISLRPVQELNAYASSLVNFVGTVNVDNAEQP